MKTVKDNTIFKHTPESSILEIIDHEISMHKKQIRELENIQNKIFRMIKDEEDNIDENDTIDFEVNNKDLFDDDNNGLPFTLDELDDFLNRYKNNKDLNKVMDHIMLWLIKDKRKEEYCEFCDPSNTREILRNDSGILKIGNSYDIIVNHFNDNGDSINDVKYCPMCGRKLG